LELVKIGAEALIAVERIGHEGDVLERGEEVEERIRRRGDEHLVAALAEQLEDPAVGLAGARGETDAIGGDREATLFVVAGDGLARGRVTEGGGRVRGAARVAEEGHEIGATEADARGVALSEIDERAAFGAGAREELREG